ncbi:MAG TPA: ATP-binding protein [Opitutaceae bacterium]|nr:ATP-binding protein [Opitutaceae bacterium]
MNLGSFHSLLRRQLRRYFGDQFEVPAPWRGFVAAVDDTYRGSDADREMLERSLEISSNELLQANSEMRAVFQAIPDLLFRVDHQGVILAVKAGVTSDLLLEPRLLIGRRIQDVPFESASRQLQTAIAQVVQEKKPITVEYSLTRQGQEYIYEARLAPALDNQIVIIIRNNTERKRLEEQLRQSQKMEAFGQLAGGVAHDFNNILTVIQGNVSLLQAPQLSAADRAAAISETLRAAERAGNLTRQLLTFSRRQPIQLRDTDANEIVANMTRMLQRIIGEHIILETRYAPGGAPVRADSGMLEQALMNLAVNSRDAMPEGGRLTLETAAITLTAADVLNRPKARPGAFVRLRVIDTGCGIAPEYRSHLFEPFFTTKEVGKGTGLGLATVFGIVEQHAGWIEVESQTGAGTTFSLFLPRLPYSLMELAQSSPPPSVRGGSETILVVEDEASVRGLMCRLLERHGYRVLAAESGAAALAVWREHRASIDLLVTDMVMPGGIGGRELANHLRAEKPSLKVIHCSGYTDEMLGPDSPLRDTRSFLAKPFDHPAFLRRVRECLDGR